MNRLFLSILLAISSGLPSIYPQIDPSYWLVGQFGNGEIHNAKKKVWTSTYNSVDKMVFYSLRIHGIYYGGNYYSYSHASGESISTTSLSKVYSGTYYFSGTSVTVTSQIDLHKDGTFYIAGYFNQSQDPGKDYIYYRMDHDIDGYDNDIVEHKAFYKNRWPWYASTNSSNVYYNEQSMYDSDPKVGGTHYITHNALLRIAEADAPERQFGIVLLPNGGGPGGGSNTRVTFGRFSEDNHSLPPSFGSGVMQDVHDEGEPWAPYAWRGRDNVTYIGAAGYSSTIKGRMFQRSNARSIKLYNYVVNGTYTPDMNLIINNGRSSASAINDLTNSTYTASSKTGFADIFNGDTCSPGDVDDFMYQAREAFPATNSDANGENFRDYFAEMGVLNCIWEGHPTASGVGWGRHGGIVFWARIKEHTSDPAERKRQAMYVYLHEMGHAFGFQHNWSQCGEDYDTCEGPCAVPSNRTIMSYGHGCGDGTLSSAGIPVTWSFSILDLNKNGPESWVKSGRRSSGVGYYFPDYTPYEGSN